MVSFEPYRADSQRVRYGLWYVLFLEATFVCAVGAHDFNNKLVRVPPHSHEYRRGVARIASYVYHASIFRMFFHEPLFLFRPRLGQGKDRCDTRMFTLPFLLLLCAFLLFSCMSFLFLECYSCSKGQASGDDP